MQTPAIPFRLANDLLARQLQQFNAREEIHWFGFKGAFESPGSAVITVGNLASGVQGGGGTSALNGGVISAGFDAAFVLAGLSQYESEVVVTLELSVKFLSLAKIDNDLRFQVHVIRSAKNFCFAEGFLARAGAPDKHFSTATAIVAPAR